MQIRRIEIRDFRKLGHVVIDGLGDGLSVIVGDNEAGKSTVLAALRAVLFERHRVTGDAARRMLPYGQTVRPEVTLAFDYRGERFTLRKAFHQRPEAALEGPGGLRLAGDAVEDHLAALFRFTPPGRGESKPGEHQGLYGLLWVEQGRAPGGLGIGGGRDTLAAVLDGEVGQLTGGERGRALLSRAGERREAFWGRNDRPRGPYRQMAEDLLALEARRAEVAQSLDTFDDKVARLAAKEEALARHARDDRLAGAVEAVRARRAAVARATAVERVRDEAGMRRQQAARDLALAAERRQRRRDAMAESDATEADFARRSDEAEAARRLLAGRRDLAEADAGRLDAARRARVACEEGVRRRQAARDWRRRAEALAAAEARLSRAESHAQARDALKASVAGLTVPPRRLAELDALERAADQAHARRDAASVQIVFTPEGGAAVFLDEVAVEPGVPLRLSRDATLRLEGFGRLAVRPGGGVEALARAAEAADRALAEALRALGFAGLEAARAAAARATEAAAEIKTHERLLGALVPEGIEALRAAAAGESAILARTRPDPADEGDGAETGAAEAALAEARHAESAADAMAVASRLARDGADRDVAVALDRVANARARRDSRAAELAAARTRAGDDRLDAEEAEAARGLARAEAEARQAEGALAGLDPETMRLDLERAETAEGVIRRDIDTLRAEKRDLDVELAALGQAGLGEELGELDGRIERMRRDKAARDLEAEASRLLHDVLSDAQRDAKERWLGPVRERVRPYLRFIEPDSDILLNEETLELEGLVRRGVAEPFAGLSMGAREQVAVITRLALADILKAAGQPAVLILDDALVNSDEGRLERMHRVLQTAAKSLQVLVLTCRERDFVGLGDLKRL